MLASAAVRLVWFCISHGTAADACTLIVHLVVPFLSCALLAAFILRGALRLCTIPVGLGCLFFVLKALSFPSRSHTVLCCIPVSYTHLDVYKRQTHLMQPSF